MAGDYTGRMDEGRIVSDPAIMLGKPTIRGTRITVEFILEELAAGKSIEELLAGHARLDRDDILAVLGFAHQLVQRQCRPAPAKA